MDFTFQMRTTLRETVNSCDPSKKKDTPVTASLCGMRATSSPVAVSHKYAKPEDPPPASNLSSGLNANAWGLPSSCKELPTCVNVLFSIFHKMIVPSALPVASH